MRVLHDLEPNEGSNRGAGHYIACPMRVVVDARQPYQTRASVKYGAHVEGRVRRPELCFSRQGRGERECCNGVARWKGLVFIVLEASPELEIVWSVDVSERALPSGENFEPTANRAGEED